MAATAGTWTLEQLHRLPDDGNKYELVRGKLFVTPAPSFNHEVILARLSRILSPYVEAHGLGYIFHPRAVVRFEGSEVEPDLMVRRGDDPHLDWDSAPIPILVVEVASPATRRRDRTDKRDLYLDAKVAEYWILDPDSRAVTVVRPGEPDSVVRDALQWHPAGATAPLAIQVASVFGESTRA